VKFLIVGAILGGFAYEAFLRPLSARARGLIAIVALWVVLAIALEVIR